jgi:hypothetical protein
VRPSPALPRLLLPAALGVAAAVPRAGAAQFFDPDNKILCWTCNSHGDHFAGGALTDAALHVMPFVKTSWETPGGRVAVVAVAGVGWELIDYAQCRQRRTCGRQDHGFGVIDLAYDVAGAAALELVIAGLKRVPGLKRLL